MKMIGLQQGMSLTFKYLGFIIGSMKPNKTYRRISRILDEQYNSSSKGLPGNDDLGTMGAWYVFASIGLYPMIPGVARLIDKYTFI